MISMNVTRKQRVPQFGMALALACGIAVTATALETPAHAQKKAKKEEAKAAYSEAFVKAYQPAAPLANANPRDGAAMRAAVPAIAAAASTPDDKLAGGQFIYAAGSAANDSALQLQGLSMMLGSGKVSAASLGQYNFIAGQLAYQAKDYAKSREFLQAAVQAGYTENDPTLMLADTYFQQNDTAGGLAYLNQAIDRQIAAGQKPSSDVVRRGLAAAYKAQNKEQSLRFANLFARHYPSADSWGDAIIVTRASTQLTDDELLDLLRLQRKTKTFRDGREYLSYVEMADPRKLPAEVIQVINEGYASNLLERNNTYASDSLKEAKAREAAAKADMASLERDAIAASARLATVMAAGNVFLSSGQPAKAEQFFQKALTLPGVDTVVATNRLGIAQLEQGKYADALATFNKVQGNRAAVSQLWAAYAQQRQGGAAGA